jgi:hypothetical protein
MTTTISSRRKLTIGMATFDDYDGVYFTIQSIRMYHKDILDDIEFIIVDNNPESEHGKCLREFCKWVKEPIKYIPYVEMKGTSSREQVFTNATTDYVLCMDCHVLLESGSISELIKFFDSGNDNGNIVQGPLLYDNLADISTHFKEDWGCQMFGKWALDERAALSEAFEIPMQGLGVFACRKSSWIGFCKDFKGFGCEEFFVAEQHRQAGRKVVCLPSLKWVHRFARPAKIPYPISAKDKYQNYLIGFKKLNLDTSPITNHFLDYVGRIQLTEWEKELL